MSASSRYGAARQEGLQQRAISLVVRIAAFQAVDPGSNPGWRITFCFSNLDLCQGETINTQALLDYFTLMQSCLSV